VEIKMARKAKKFGNGKEFPKKLVCDEQLSQPETKEVEGLEAITKKQTQCLS